MTLREEKKEEKCEKVQFGFEAPSIARIFITLNTDKRKDNNKCRDSMKLEIDNLSKSKVFEELTTISSIIKTH